MLGPLDRGIYGKEIVPNKKHKFQEGAELDYPTMVCVRGVFTRQKSEVEPQLNQVGDIPSFGVGGGVCRVHDGVDGAQGGGLFPLDWGDFNPISFDFSGDVIV